MANQEDEQVPKVDKWDHRQVKNAMHTCLSHKILPSIKLDKFGENVTIVNSKRSV